MPSGSRASSIVRKKPSSSLVTNFRQTMEVTYTNYGVYLLKKFLLNNQVLRRFACIDKKMITQSSEPVIRSLLDHRLINPFSTNILLLYPFKTFSDVFRGYRSGTLVENGLNNIIHEDEIKGYEKNYPKLPARKHNDGDEIKCLLWYFKQRKQYSLLLRMVLAIMSNFTSPKVESSFSVMGDGIDKISGRMIIETYSGIPTIKYGLRDNSSTQVSKILFDHPK